MIYPPLNGGEGRIFNLLRGLSKRYRISIMVPRQDNREEEYRAAAMELQHGLVNKVHLAEELGQALEQALQDEKIDIVQFEFHEMGRYARFVRGRVSTIITEHDAGFLSWKRSYIRPPVSRYPGESLVNFAWQWLEAARLFRHCDHLVAVSQTDARLLNRWPPDIRFASCLTALTWMNFLSGALHGAMRAASFSWGIIRIIPMRTPPSICAGRSGRC